MTSPDSPAPPRVFALRPWLVVAGLMVLLVVLRIFPGWGYLVLPDREPRLPDPDAYFHFRQAAYTVGHFPHLMRWDDLSLYPAVLRNDAAGLYDLTLAGLAKLVALFGLTQLRALWWVCLWFPPLCTAALLPFVYLLTRRLSSVAIGLTMALWCVLLPGTTLAHLTLGICDHHVVEMLIGVLSIFLLHRLVTRERETPSAGWRPAWGTALPLAILQFTWLGGPLFLLLFAGAVLGQLAADVLAGASPRPLVRAAVRAWLALFLLIAGAGLLVPDLILLPLLWKLTLAGTGGFIALLLGALRWFETSRSRQSPVRRLAWLAGALAIGGAVVFALSPAARHFAGEGLGQKSTLVAENQPVTPGLYWMITGLAGILGPLALVVGIASGAWRRPGWWIAVLPSLFFLALWCRTFDYGYQAALHAVLLTGYFFGAAPARKWSGLCALAGATALVIFCCWPMHRTMPWWLPGAWYENEAELPGDGWIEAMRWLRTSTPPPPPLPPHPVEGVSPRGRVGVLTDWSSGQYVNTLAERPATSSRYPEAEGIAPFFLLTEAAVRAAPMRGATVTTAVRYVAVEPKVIGDYAGAHLSTLGRNLADFAGRDTFVDGRGHTMSVPTLGPGYAGAFATQLVERDGAGLEHFRLIFESRQQSFLRLTYDDGAKQLMPRASLVRTPAEREDVLAKLRQGLWQENGANAYLGHLVAAVKIFEQVAGARLEGSAAPGAAVAAEIPVRLRSSGRLLRYRQTGRADSAGHFQLIVPYATEAAAGTDLVPAGKAWLFVGDGTPRPLMISEAAVQRGDRVICATP